MKEDIKKDGHITEFFHQKRAERVQEIDKLGKDRLKTTTYNPDGTKRDVHSFHDPAVGKAVRSKTIGEAIIDCANKSISFYDTLHEIKEQCTYSNLNLDYGLIKDTNKPSLNIQK